MIFLWLKKVSIFRVEFLCRYIYDWNSVLCLLGSRVIKKRFIFVQIIFAVALSLVTTTFSFFFSIIITFTLFKIQIRHRLAIFFCHFLYHIVSSHLYNWLSINIFIWKIIYEKSIIFQSDKNYDSSHPYTIQYMNIQHKRIIAILEIKKVYSTLNWSENLWMNLK